MLKGQAKTDYQRDYMRRRRGSNTRSNRVGLTGSNKLDELRGLISGIEAKPTVQPTLYNPAVHRPGDRVLIQQGKKFMEIVIPELDAGGSPMPEYT